MSDQSHQPLLESRSMIIGRDARRGTLEFGEGAGYSGSKAMPSVEGNRPARTYCFVTILQSRMLVRKKTSGERQTFGALQSTLLERIKTEILRSKLSSELSTKLLTETLVIPEWIQTHRVPNHSFEDLGAPGDDVEVAEHHYALPSRPALYHCATEHHCISLSIRNDLIHRLMLS